MYLYAQYLLHWNLSYGSNGIIVCAYDIVCREDFLYVIKFPKTTDTCLRILKDKTFECSNHKVYTLDYILKMFPIDYNDELTYNEFNFSANNEVQEMFERIIIRTERAMEDKKYAIT